jgi:hypothetical protein
MSPALRRGLVAGAVTVAVIGAAIATRSWRRTHSVPGADAAIQAPEDMGEPSDWPDAGPARRLLVEGLVRAGGKAVSGATIDLGGPGGVRTVKSGPDGAFAFLGVPEGRFALRATRDTDTAYLPEVTGSEVGAGKLLAVELVRGVRVTGHLRDRMGRAIAGGEAILMEDAGAPLPRKAASGIDGTFRFEAVVPGRYQVTARADGFLPPQPVLTSAPGAVELKLDRAACVDGKVVDERARAVPGASLEVSGEGPGGVPIAVTAAAASGDSPLRLEAAGELGILRGPLPYPPRVPAAPTAPAQAAQSFESDAKGAFKVCGVPPGRVVVAASHADFMRAASDPFQLGAGSTVTMQLVLRKGASGSGLVLDDRGSGVGGARIAVFAAQPPARMTVTDAAGRFRVDGLAAGPYKVEVSHADFPTLVRGGVDFDGEQRFELALGGGLDGDLRDARTGAQPAGAKLILRHGADEKLIPLARARFTAYGLPTGGATLIATAPGYVTWKKEITIPAATRPRETTVRDLRIDLERAGSITGQLRDDRGDPVPGAAITSGTLVIRTDERGEFTLDGIAPGRAVVEAALGTRNTRAEVEVRAAEPTRIDLRF